MSAHSAERWTNEQGYVRLERAFEHREVMRDFLRGQIPEGAHVHHRNRNRQDNRFANLLLVPNDTWHRLIHEQMRTGSAEAVSAVEEPCLVWAELYREYHLAGSVGPAPVFSGELRRRSRPTLSPAGSTATGRRFIVRPTLDGRR